MEDFLEHQRRVMSYCVNTMNTVVHTVNNQSRSINRVAEHVNKFSINNTKRKCKTDFSIDSDVILKKIKTISPYQDDISESKDFSKVYGLENHFDKSTNKSDMTVDATVVNEEDDNCSDFTDDVVIPDPEDDLSQT